MSETATVAEVQAQIDRLHALSHSGGEGTAAWLEAMTEGITTLAAQIGVRPGPSMPLPKLWHHREVLLRSQAHQLYLRTTYDARDVGSEWWWKEAIEALGALAAFHGALQKEAT